MGTSLLVSGAKSCTSSDPFCSTAPDSPTVGDLAIQAEPIPAVNIDQSDIVEVTGTCVDLGRKKNRILVEVFAGENDESVDPYITNEITSNCYSINGAAALTSSGLFSNEKCFWVTKGVGLVEDAGLPSQKDFPQCHDGQFGFAIKLGKILNDTGSPLGTNYLVRYKIRTDEGGISDSAWTRTTISRQLSPPKVSSTLYDPVDHSCHLTMDVSRFNPNLFYSLYRDFKLVGGGATPKAPEPFYGNPNGLSPGAYNFENFNLVDGVTYNYSLSVIDTQFSYLPALTPVFSNSIPCQTTAPQIVSSPSLPPPGSCMFYINNYNPNPAVTYQIKAFTAGTWTSSATDPSVAYNCTSGNLQVTCSVSGLASGVNYFFAVRQFKDTIVNGLPDLLAEEVGKWSSELNCRPP